MFHGVTFRSRIFFFYSQLNFALFKLFQRPFPLTRGESGGELGGLNSSKELHQEQKSEREMGKKYQFVCLVQLKKRFHWCRVLQPVRRLPGVGETEDGAELHVQDEVEDEQRLFAQRAGDVILLKTKIKPQGWPDLLTSTNPVSLPWHLLIRSYCQTLGEIKAILTEGGRCCSAAADGAEEPGLVEAQLLQLLRVLCQRGRKQQLLQRHLRWRQTAYKHESCGLFSRFRPLATVMLGWAELKATVVTTVHRRCGSIL